MHVCSNELRHVSAWIKMDNTREGSWASNKTLHYRQKDRNSPKHLNWANKEKKNEVEKSL